MAVGHMTPTGRNQRVLWLSQPTFFSGFSPRLLPVEWWCPPLINPVETFSGPEICSCQILDLFKWMLTTTFCPPSLQNHELNKPLFFINHPVSSVLLQLLEQAQDKHIQRLASQAQGLPFLDLIYGL